MGETVRDETDDDLLAETGPEPSPAAVADYLRRHPDFLIENQELIAALTPPSRFESGDRVVDIQQFMVGQLRREADNLRETARHVIDTSRSNMAMQTRVHTAVLMLMAAQNMEDLLRVGGHDMALPLGIDAVAMAFEAGEGDAIADPLPEGMVDALVGEEREIQLVADYHDEIGLFGEALGVVRSAAMARLRAGPKAPAGILALGSRTRGTFHPRQGTELLVFLARVAERLAFRILEHENP